MEKEDVTSNELCDQILDLVSMYHIEPIIAITGILSAWLRIIDFLYESDGLDYDLKINAILNFIDEFKIGTKELLEKHRGT